MHHIGCKSYHSWTVPVYMAELTSAEEVKANDDVVDESFKVNTFCLLKGPMVTSTLPVYKCDMIRTAHSTSRISSMEILLHLHEV